MATIEEMKIVVVGGCGVGKTSLVLRYCSSTFKPISESTIGASFHSKMVISKEKKVKFKMWDTAGQEKYRSMMPMYMRSADAALVLYDVTRRCTFLEFESFYKSVRQNISKKGLIVLIGTKCDLDQQREVSRKEGESLAKQIGIPFFEVSSKDNICVEEAFQFIANMVNSTDEEPTSSSITGLSESVRSAVEYFRQHGETLQISGAISYFNSNRINGCYAPEINLESYTEKVIAGVGAMIYRNMDAPDIVLVRTKTRWIVQFGSGRIIAYLNRASTGNLSNIPSFGEYMEDTIKNKVWYERCGFVFTYFKHVPSIKCQLFKEQQQKMANELFDWHEGNILDIDKFLQASAEPEQLGLNIPLFIRFVQFRALWLEMEFYYWKKEMHFEYMEKISAQRQQLLQIRNQLQLQEVDEPATTMLINNKSEKAEETTSTNDSQSIRLLMILRPLIYDCEIRFEALCDLTNGNFAAARNCRDTVSTLRCKLSILEESTSDEDLAKKIAKPLLPVTEDIPQSISDSATIEPPSIVSQQTTKVSTEVVDQSNTEETKLTEAELDHGMIKGTNDSIVIAEQEDIVSDDDDDDAFGDDDESTNIEVKDEDASVSADAPILQDPIANTIEALLVPQNSAAMGAVKYKGSNIVITRVGFQEEYSGENCTSTELEWRCSVTSGLSAETSTKISALLTGGMPSVCGQLSLDMHWSSFAKKETTYEHAIRIPAGMKLIVYQEVLEGYVEREKRIHLTGDKKKRYYFRIKKEKVRYETIPLAVTTS